MHETAKLRLQLVWKVWNKHCLDLKLHKRSASTQVCLSQGADVTSLMVIWGPCPRMADGWQQFWLIGIGCENIARHLARCRQWHYNSWPGIGSIFWLWRVWICSLLLKPSALYPKSCSGEYQSFGTVQRRECALSSNSFNQFFGGNPTPRACKDLLQELGLVYNTPFTGLHSLQLRSLRSTLVCGREMLEDIPVTWWRLWVFKSFQGDDGLEDTSSLFQLLSDHYWDILISPQNPVSFNNCQKATRIANRHMFLVADPRLPKLSERVASRWPALGSKRQMRQMWKTSLVPRPLMVAK